MGGNISCDTRWGKSKLHRRQGYDLIKLCRHVSNIENISRKEHFSEKLSLCYICFNQLTSMEITTQNWHCHSSIGWMKQRLSPLTLLQQAKAQHTHCLSSIFLVQTEMPSLKHREARLQNLLQDQVSCLLLLTELSQNPKNAIQVALLP